MNHRLAAVCTAALLAAAPAYGQPAPAASAAAGPHHRLDIRIDPAGHRLVATDEVTWPNASLVRPPHVRAQRRADDHARRAARRGSAPRRGARRTRDRGRLPRPPQGVPHRAGRCTDSRSRSPTRVSSTRRSRTRRRSTRAGSATHTGLIGPEGVYLAGSTVWHARFGPELVTFELTAAAPAAWHVISQGNGTSRGADGKARWASGGPMDEIYLVGGPLHQFKDSAGAIETLVYLHEQDAALAGKYLAATAQYLEMYRSLHRPVSLRQVRAGRELLGDGIRDADLHAARPAGHPLPLHHQLVVPARDPAQLVGQLRVRGLRHRQLVRGADGVPGRSPDSGTARGGRRVPPLDAAEVPRLRAHGARLPPRRVPRALQRGHRGGRVRQGAHGLPRPQASHRRRRVPRDLRAVLLATSRAGARRSATFSARPKRRAASRSDGSSTTSSHGRARRSWR